ncbi:MAG TPA: FlgD immunoglobulin-like domain containing protein, partial [Rhodothermales bacterium]|nr:FlgD immunoglobulin-like domain containing protein [Rhodothermales bacterium]
DLLRVAPDYEPDRDQDPPPFIDLVSEVKREIRQAPRREPEEPGVAAKEGGGVSKWLLIGGGVVLAGAVAVLLASGGGDDDDGGGGIPQPTTLDEQEPNNTLAQAQVLRGTPPITVRGNVEVSDVGDIVVDLTPLGVNDVEDLEDVYRITLTEPGVDIRLSGLSSDCDLFLLNAQATQYINSSFNSGTTAERINDPSLAAGTYLVGVTIFDADPQGPTSTSYTLVVDAAVSGNSQRRATADLQAVGGAEIAQNFRLVAGADAMPLASAISPVATSWTGYHETGQRLVEHDGTDAFRFQSGRGFWVQSDQPVESAIHKADAVVGESYSIPLEGGWNIIANPFGSSIDWAAMQAANGISQHIWRWDGHFSQTDTFTPAYQGEAFYFMNATGLEALTIPASVAQTRLPDLRQRSMLTLTAHREEHIASTIEVGFAPDASPGFDGYDQFAPPGYFEAASLRLTRATRGPALATEMRPWQGEGQTFEVALAAPAHAPITLRADGLAAFSGRRVYLVDLERSVVYDLHRQPSVTVVPEEATHRLRLIIGTASFAEATSAELVSQNLALGNYPNPFNPSTSITYTVPSKSQPVRLEVFDVTGRLVQVLVDGVQEAGAHQITWGGTDRTGVPVASGVYLSRLRVGEQVRVHRMLLMK